MRKIALIVFLISFTTLYSQTTLTTSEIRELKELYKENYEDWIVNDKIKLLLKENPDIDSIIQTVDIRETKVFQQIKKELSSNKTKNNIDVNYIFNDKILDKTFDGIIKALDPENTKVITNLFHKIANDNRTKDVADLVLRHMQKAVDDISREAEKIKVKKR